MAQIVPRNLLFEACLNCL